MCGIEVKRLPSPVLAENLPFEREHLDICLTPALFRKPCLCAGVFKKCHAVPAIFGGYLGKQKPACPPAAHDQAMPAYFNFF
jgi:hypothetical protein